MMVNVLTVQTAVLYCSVVDYLTKFHGLRSFIWSWYLVGRAFTLLCSRRHLSVHMIVAMNSSRMEGPVKSSQLVLDHIGKIINKSLISTGKKWAEALTYSGAAEGWRVSSWSFSRMASKTFSWQTVVSWTASAMELSCYTCVDKWFRFGPKALATEEHCRQSLIQLSGGSQKQQRRWQI